MHSTPMINIAPPPQASESDPARVRQATGRDGEPIRSRGREASFWLPPVGAQKNLKGASELPAEVSTSTGRGEPVVGTGVVVTVSMGCIGEECR